MENINEEEQLKKRQSTVPDKIREEGELSSSDDSSSSDDDDNDKTHAPNPVTAAARSTETVNPPTTTMAAQVSPCPKPIPGIQTGRVISGINTANTNAVQPHTSAKQNNALNQNSRATFKSPNREWNAPSGDTNNLVISFSDDDSGSESEDQRQKRALVMKGNRTKLDCYRGPASILSGKSSKAQQTAQVVNKVIPKGPSRSRTFISSISKNNRAGNSRGVSASAPSTSIDHGSRVRNFNAIKRNLASQEHQFGQEKGLNSTKLQDLRQQIALRERELKLKAAVQSKDCASVSSRDYSAVNLGRDAAKKSNGIFGGIVNLEPREPDRKRLKVGESFSTMLKSDSRQDAVAAKSTLPSDGQSWENSGFEDRNIVDYCQKASSGRRAESSIAKWQKHDFRRVDSSENLPGIDINNNSSQSGGSSMQVDPHAMLNQNIPVPNTTSILFKKTKTVESKKNITHQPLGSMLNRNEQNLLNSRECHEGIYGGKALSNSIFQTSLKNVSPWDNSCTLDVAGNSNVDMESLVAVEETLDKELEEAQQYRHICEIEERNALKAYWKAQRALFEASSRCRELYRKRELHSAHFRSLIINDSNFLWSSGQHKDYGPSNISGNIDIVPLTSDQMRPSYEQYVRAPLKTSFQQMSGHHLGSEPFSEPDASTSEQLPHDSKSAPNGFISPSNDPEVSADEDEGTFPLDHETAEPSFKPKEQDSVARQGTNVHLIHNLSLDSPDLILEAELRSKLVARLGLRTSSKNSGSSDLEPADEPGTENENGSERTQASNDSVPLSESTRNQEHNLGGNDNPRSISEVQIQKHDKALLNLHSPDDSENKSSGALQLKIFSISLPVSVLRSAFGQLRPMSAIIPLVLDSKISQEGNPCDYNNEEKACYTNSEEIQRGNMAGNLLEECIVDICGREAAVFTSDIVIDPFWPLCMFELRGKCNNNECPWQHLRDVSVKNVYQRQHNDSASADCQIPISAEKCSGGKNSDFECDLRPPTYLVGLDLLKAKTHSYEPVIARKQGQCWLKCFSFCLALSNLLHGHFLAGGSLFSGSDGRIEVYGKWDRQLSFFRSRDGLLNHPNQVPVSNVQPLEMALLILSEEGRRFEGVKKVLSMLSRAIEADPTSEILWITYLLTYYSRIEFDGKNEMFFQAVKKNSRSYGLWIMYVNSHKHLDDRLVAYDAALLALCCQTSGREKDETHASCTGLSACILDLFLQMIDCLRMSGNIGKAIYRISGLLVETNSDEPHSLLLSDILSCLTISDKYMFWVCCVYFVIYRKLPDAVVHHLECEKELIPIEWPFVQLQDEDKRRAIKLVEMAVDSGKAYVGAESLEYERNARCTQYFALNHVRCILAIDGLGFCQNLLDKYTKMYPPCIELMLISARIQSTDLAASSFEGFEEALGNWPKELPGIHCIWNQYIEWALQKGYAAFAKELTVRWFNSVSKLQNTNDEVWDATDCNGSSNGVLKSTSASDPNFLVHCSSQMDIMFGYINLSLAKLLHDDPVESRIAIDKALKAADPMYFRHCLREHAALVFIHELKLKRDFPVTKQLSILSGYVENTQAFPEPLSRKFVNNIERPKVKQLVDNILSPVSFDSSLVNLVLEVWYGPSLLPANISKPKELVDFVEAILGIVPSNYQLVFCLCKMLLTGEYSSFSIASGSSILYWASSTLVSAIFHAVPIPPEYALVEAAHILGDIAGGQLISDDFFKRALSVYPFSVQLWSLYNKLSKNRKDISNVLEAAREKGVEVG